MPSEPLDQLHRAVSALQQTVATLDGTVRTLKVTVDMFRDEIKDDIARLEKGVERQDDRWSRLAWFVGLAVLAGVLGLVIIPGGVRGA